MRNGTVSSIVTGGSDQPVIFTIGHSTRSLDELIEMLRAHSVSRLGDVRTIPRSRRHPQFNAEALASSLPEAGIEYMPFKSLGGLRKPRKDSINTGWRNESFRGYADYMQTPEFAAALAGLIEQASQVPTAIMCAEAVPWRCHRSLIADALLARGWTVKHILETRAAGSHSLTPFARVSGAEVTYPEPGLFA